MAGSPLHSACSLLSQKATQAKGAALARFPTAFSRKKAVPAEHGMLRAEGRCLSFRTVRYNSIVMKAGYEITPCYADGVLISMNTEYFLFDWGCVGGTLSRCEGVYHDVIVERAAVAIVSRILEHLLANKKVDSPTQRVMHFYLAPVLFGTHMLDDNEVFKDVMRQVG